MKLKPVENKTEIITEPLFQRLLFIRQILEHKV
jgi:hypothetical protein